MINDRFHGDYDWSIGVIGRGITLVLPLSSDKNADPRSSRDDSK